MKNLRLHFDVGALPEVLGDELNYARTASPLLMLYDERVTRCAQLLANECNSNLPENRMYGESLTMALMAALFGAHKQSNRGNDSGLARWQLSRVLEFLESHLGHDIGLEELARLVGLSQSQFARAFKASTGLPLYKWWLSNRIKRAQEMLLNSSHSLSEIAMQNGFCRSKSFHQDFSSRNGYDTGGLETSPSELRPMIDQKLTQQYP
jgi:AraC family transcriptional regulator